MPLPVYKSYYTEYRRAWLNSGHVLGLVPVFYFLNIFIVQNVYTVMCFYCSACFGQLQARGFLSRWQALSPLLNCFILLFYEQIKCLYVMYACICI